MRRTTTLFLVAIGVLQAAPPPCLTPLAANEPLCNPAASSSEWGATHRGSYAQASSPFPGPLADQPVTAEHLVLPGPPISLDFTSPYLDGGRAIWSSPLTLEGVVAKIDHRTFQVIDRYVPAERETDPPSFAIGTTGAYNVVDRDNNFITARSRWIEVFRDKIPGDRFSPIRLVKRFFLPDAFFCREDDVLIGLTLTYDGRLAFATKQGVVGTLPRKASQMSADALRSHSINAAACGDPTIPAEDLEGVSNSVAADENGGVYVVTSKALYRFDDGDDALTLGWRSEYETEVAEGTVRLGEGSGSTPSLMGTRYSDDRFVVITDGKKLMNLVLYWRDEIPGDWQPIAPGKDPRIACEVPVTFGDPSAEESLSEQSVLVRGYGAVVVNNLLADDSAFASFLPIYRRALSALAGGDPTQAPYGVERIDWDPETRTCQTKWVNSQISIPNGIPAMSAATGLIYAVGQRNGAWGLERIDWETGASRGFAPSSMQTCSLEAVLSLNPLLGIVILGKLFELPASCENSFYAGAEVGPDGAVYTGTFQGISKFSPASVPEISALEEARAGIGQGLDLLDRAQALTVDVDRLDALVRAALQLTLTQGALLRGQSNGDIAAGPANDAFLQVGAGSALLQLAGWSLALDGAPSPWLDDWLEGARQALRDAAESLQGP